MCYKVGRFLSGRRFQNFQDFKILEIFDKIQREREREMRAQEVLRDVDSMIGQFLNAEYRERIMKTVKLEGDDTFHAALLLYCLVVVSSFLSNNNNNNIIIINNRLP